MRIETVRIRNFRCLRDVSLDLDDYTVLIGPNGTGKSSVIYALNWFFNGGNLSELDLHDVESEVSGTGEAAPGADVGANGFPTISVEVTFGDLTDADAAVLGRYARGSTARFRRSWTSGQEKIVGNSLQGPGFAAARSCDHVADLRAAYRALREDGLTLPDVTLRREIEAALNAWEDDPANTGQLVEVADADATHLFGFVGQTVLSRRFRMALVPATADMASEVGESSKGTALSVLVGTLTSDAVDQAKAAWEHQHSESLRELENAIEQGANAAIQHHVDLISENLRRLVPNAEFRMPAEPSTWTLKGDAALRPQVFLGGLVTDVERQGHGVQRALMMAVLQAIVAPPQHAEAEGEPAEGDERENPIDRQPAFLLAMEEPEIYQHPVRARHFARVLTDLAANRHAQVLLATHSPYFVHPSQFASLRRFSLEGRETMVVSTSIREIVDTTELDESRVQRRIDKEIPRAFAESFFAETVVLVEGETDQAVLEALADRIGSPLEARGVVVLNMEGKENLRIPAAILACLGVPSYVIADGDAGSAERKWPEDEDRQKLARHSHQQATETLESWLPESNALVGELPLTFGGPTTVTNHWAVFHDDIENELAEWPSFIDALHSEGTELRDKRAAAYRNGVIFASLEDLPASVRAVADAVVALSEGGNRGDQQE